jgi:hypothetical protein
MKGHGRRRHCSAPSGGASIPSSSIARCIRPLLQRHVRRTSVLTHLWLVRLAQGAPWLGRNRACAWKWRLTRHRLLCTYASSHSPFPVPQLGTFMIFMRNYLLSYVIEDPDATDKISKSIVDGYMESWPDIEVDLRWKVRASTSSRLSRFAPLDPSAHRSSSSSWACRNRLKRSCGTSCGCATGPPAIRRSSTPRVGHSLSQRFVRG